MPEGRLVQLAQDLQQLVVEVGYFGIESAGLELSSFMNKQREVVTTADKIARELAARIRFNPSSLLGIDYPLEDEINSVSGLLTGLEEIKHAALHSVDELPQKTRRFAMLLENHLTREPTL